MTMYKVLFPLSPCLPSWLVVIQPLRTPSLDGKTALGPIPFIFPYSLPLRNAGLEQEQPGEEDGKRLGWVSKCSTDGPGAGGRDARRALLCPGTCVGLENMAFSVQEHKTGLHTSFLSAVALPCMM